MKLSEKHKWGMLLILLIGVIIFYIVFLPEIKKAEYFNETVKMLHKDYKIKINKNDYIGILNDKIKLATNNLTKTTKQLLKEMISDDSELVTIFYGKDISEKEGMHMS